MQLFSIAGATRAAAQLDFVMLGEDAVLTRGRWRLKMPDGKELGGMTSVIFRKLPEGWRIVHDHCSAEGN